MVDVIFGFAVLYVLQMIVFLVLGIVWVHFESFDSDVFMNSVFVPGYILYKIPATIIKKLLNVKKDKQKKEKQKYEEIIERLEYIRRNTRCDGAYLFYELYDIIDKYKTILKNDFHKDMALNRLEYIVTFMEECKKSEMLKDVDVVNEMKESISSVDNLFTRLVTEINDINDKVNKQVKEYLLTKTKEFKDVTDGLLKDPKEVENREG